MGGERTSWSTDKLTYPTRSEATTSEQSYQSVQISALSRG